MATKDISDLQVLQAVQRSMQHGPGEEHHCHVILAATTGQPGKVAWRALERANGRGLIDYGVGLQCAFLTDAGRALLASGEDAKRDH